MYNNRLVASVVDGCEYKAVFAVPVWVPVCEPVLNDKAS